MQNQGFSKKAKDIETNLMTNNKEVLLVYPDCVRTDAKGEHPEEILERWTEHF